MGKALPLEYGRPVPRYTSYPTAPHFSEAVDDAVYRTWLGGLDPALALSLYFHIPFCREMCWFCGCHTKIVKRGEPVRRYLDSLRAEINLMARALPGRFTVKHIHWGGGSPSLMSCGDYSRLTDDIRARFRIADDAEIAIELDPRTALDSYIAALAASGVNRVSIGVQDFNPHVQKAINRKQSFEDTERVMAGLRRHGIGKISVDLLYGLPHQTVDSVLETIDRTIRLCPSRIALFGYAHVPWMKKHQRLIDETALPDAETRLRIFQKAAERLTAYGYCWIGLDHFALPGDPLSRSTVSGGLRRNFQGYTTDDAPVLLGLGASSIGCLPQGYVQNETALPAYQKSVAEGRLPAVRGITLSRDDKLRRDIVERLMCDLSVDLDAVCRDHGTVAAKFGGVLRNLDPLIDDGLVVIEGNRITVTPAGRPFVRLVAANFDAYLQTGEKRHSQAV